MALEILLQRESRRSGPIAARRHDLWLLATVSTGCLAGSPALAQTTDAPGEAKIGEVVVTGTSIRIEKAVGSDLITVEREEIEQIGAPNTAELLASIPQLNSFNSLARPGLGGALGVATAPGLRGLPPGATLVLLDGHRLVGDSPLRAFPDPSSIPPGAIERVEIVADGASAIYGSDAVSGVINIITRRNLNGEETSLRVGLAPHGYEMGDASQAFGRTWSGGSAMVVVAYNESDNLQNQDLPGYTNDLRPFGGVDLRPMNCSPPNIRIGTTTYAPPSYAPGLPGRCEPGALADAVPVTRRKSVMANLHQDLTDNLSVFADLKYSATNIASHSAPGNANLTINSTNPFFQAPPGVTATSETVLYNVLPVTGVPMTYAHAKSGNLIAGLTYALPRDWRLSASVNHGRSDSRAGNFTFNAALLNAAAAGTSPLDALDPFGDRTNPSVAAAIADFENPNASEQKLYDYQVKVDGALFTLPGGEVKLALGGDYRTNSYDASSWAGPSGQQNNLAVVSAERKVTAAFAEVFFPLVGPDNAMPLVQSLNFSAAARYDKYSDFGSTSNPKFGATWSPFADLVLRGSYGKSFHAPDMGDSYAVDTRAIFFANFPIVPPGSPPVDTIVLAGGNPGLEPETGESYSFGVEYDPSWLRGFRTSVTYYSIEYDNQIQTAPLSQQIFINPAFRDFTVLNPTRAQLDEIERTFRLISMTPPIPQVGQILDLRRQNLASTNIRGVDFRGEYRWNTDFGTWAAGLSGNRILDREAQATPSSPVVSQPGIQKWNSRGTLAWMNGPISANAAVNYSGRFEQTYVLPIGGTATYHVKPFITLDLRASYELAQEGWLDGTTLSVNVNNAINKRPPFQMTGGTGAGGTNPLGRTVWLGLLKKW